MSSQSPKSILFGCTVAIVSSAIQSLGITLQRKSHLVHYNSHNANNPHHNTQKHRRNMWLLGFSLFVTTNVLGSLIQITTLPLIILSPLQSIGLIFNSILSCLLLPGESFTKRLTWGTCFIAIGAFMIAYNGNTTEEPPPQGHIDKKFEMIVRKLTKGTFLTWFVYTFVFIVFLLIVNILLTKKKKDIQNKLQKRNSRLWSKDFEKLQFIKGINYGIISGTLTAHTFLFAKSLIDVIFEAIMSQGHDIKGIFTSSNFTPYFLLLVMLGIIGFQLTAFNLGLAQISTSVLYPLCFLVYNLVNLINDLLFNSILLENKMAVSQLMLVLLGLSGVLIGVILISCTGSNNGKNGAFSSPEEQLIYSKFPYDDERRSLLELNGQYNGITKNPRYSTINSTISLNILDQDGEEENSSRDLTYEQRELITSLGLLDV